MVAVACLVPGGGAVASQHQGSGSISGRVTDDAGLPVEGVCVTVDAFIRPEPTPVTRTDLLGRYTVTDVPAGAHLVAFNLCEAPLAGRAAEWHPNAPGLLGAEPVFVTDGATTSGIDAALEPAGTIRGTVTEEGSDDPLVGECVIVVSLEAFAVGRTRTAEDGTYSLPALWPETYMAVFGDCSEPYVHITELFDDVSVEDQLAGTEPTPIQVVAGEEAVADAALTLGGGVSGVVTAEHTGEPVPFACVGLVPEDARADDPVYGGQAGVDPAGGRTDDDRYVTSPAPEGDYRVRFLGGTCDGEGYREQWHGGRDRASADVVPIRAGVVVEGVDAVLTPVPSVSLACVLGTESSFDDVNYAGVHGEAIGCLTASGIVSGRSRSRYAPLAPVRRDQMAAFLTRLLTAVGTTLPSDPADRFSDDDGNLHELAINQLAELGIVGGVAAGEYAPMRPVNRGQMATFLAAAYEVATGYTLRSPRDRFSDDAASVHEGRINHAAAAGIASGTRGRRYEPRLRVRRDQMASFLARTFDRVLRDTAYQTLFSTQDASQESDTTEEPSAAAAMNAVVQGLLRGGAPRVPAAPRFEASVRRSR